MKNKNGITLIALVITIIVLLIFAGISLSLTVGENGILTRAKEARLAHMDAEIEEEMGMAYASFKTAQETNQIKESNIYKAQVEYVKEKLEERYGDKLKEVYKSGKYTKIEFKNNDRVYVLRHDGTTYHYVRMKPTEVWGRLDENGVAYLSATKIDDRYTNINTIGNLGSENIKKVIIEEPIAPSTLSGFFSFCRNLEEIENIQNLHTENVISTDAMFYKCDKLKNLDVSNFDTSKVTNMGQMFRDLYALEYLDVSSLDTRNVINMGYMFGDENFVIKNLDLSSLDTSNVQYMNNMFQHNSVEKIDMTYFDVSKVINMNGMFTKSAIKIKTTQAVANKIMESNPNITQDNFEIID